MRKISDTIARLAALRAQHVAYADPVAHNYLRTLTDFGSNPGALKAKYHLPGDLPEGAPLVVVLHGCTQTAAAYDHHSGWSQLADKAGFALLYPEQQHANNPNLCFNWFLSNDTSRGSGEALSISQMIEAMIAAHGLDRRRIFVTGLSAGGAMAAAMLATFPEVFAGGAIIAGLPFGMATTIPEAFDRMRGHGDPSQRELQQALRSASDHQGPWPRISIWQGTADHTVVPSNADAIADQWRGVHIADKAPTDSRLSGRHAKQVWCDLSGEALIEINMIAGMGHGTPIDAEAFGAPGPYMLDVGISSTREIARFWGIEVAEDCASAQREENVSRGQRHLPRSSASEKANIPNLASPVNPSSPRVASSDPHGLKKVIEDALRAAGLMR